VRALLRDHIGSFEQLEVLLLLHREADRAWPPDAVAAELSIASPAAQEALESLQRANLLAAAREGESVLFRYALAGARLEAAVQGLARAYHESPVEVVKLMSANTIERVRTSALRTFADAFLLGKKKHG
jgi:DNA-binding transcriptional ArsR family regulator